MNKRNAYQLARMADVLTPDSKDSPGAEWLEQIQHAVEDQIDYLLEDEDASHEVSDGLVPIYTHNLWQVFVDLGLYHEESEIGLGEDMTQNAMTLCYEVARRLVYDLVEEEREERDSMPVCEDCDKTEREAGPLAQRYRHGGDLLCEECSEERPSVGEE